ncbi:hypothetical protein Poli38472_012513 [Pythium oligandrum]|uniref:Methyltransferase type 11 domain-containing protein n=1 Tax=Pythium oligandrum TaxID=41045 RepID=A0A8K1FJ15_PYTOL|nr:hypothetical protein Poli38472_012513 [Pythium oligandrum]|eukprot:TMW61322.1 hypothetical protein Poli38472_012513 [Pythium oligandrum]
MSPAYASPSPMAAVWDRHAPMYEQVFERSTSLWGLDALTLASIPDIQPGQNKPRFLDVGCEAGKFAIAVADMGYDVTATDLSSGMIERLKNKAPKHSHLTLDTLATDGQTLEGLSDNLFDYVSSIFGLTMFPQRELAWKSALRVLKPGVRHDMSFKSGEELVTGMFDNGAMLAVLSQKDVESIKLTALHYFQQIIDGVVPFSPSAKPATVDPASSPFVPRGDSRAEDHPIWCRAFSFPAIGHVALARKA